MNIRKSGFTLAEILLALFIIGVVFGISVPALQGTTANRERHSQIMKLYPILDNVINWAILENVDVDSVPFGKKDSNGNDEFSQLVVKKLRVGQDCQNSASTKGGCWFNGSFTTGGGETLTLNNDSNYYKSGLVDSTSLAIQTFDQCNSIKTIDGKRFNRLCALIYADINGADPPNKWGRDIFAFVYRKYNEDDRRNEEGSRDGYLYGLQPASEAAIEIIDRPKETSEGNGKEEKVTKYQNWTEAEPKNARKNKYGNW